MPDSESLPAQLQVSLAGSVRTRVDAGESGCNVYRIEAAGHPTRYLKSGAGRVADHILSEMVRLEWLSGRISVPTVEQFVRTSGTAYLLSTGVDGVSAYEYLTTHPGSRMKIVAALAHFLRAFHSIPIADCPFHAGHELRLADARRNVEAGLVDTSDFDDERAGWTAERVLNEASALRPAVFDRVVTHGDFSLDNVLVARGRVTGCIDVGRAGVADPYQDLAILWHNLSEFGAEVQAELFRAYGIATPNADMIRFHLCLDELF